jgi:LPXTG-site transpeptidase (sortase) family protein
MYRRFGIRLSKILPGRRWAAGSLITLVLLTILSFSVLPKKPVQSGIVPPVLIKTAVSKPRSKITSGYPIRLKIPTINVDAAIDYIALTPAGNLSAPKGPTTVGWYDLGPKPGGIGSAVIDGHFGYKNNVAAVFDNLHKLQKGDHIYIVDDMGATITFIVSDSRIYGQGDHDSGIFISRDGKAHLNLITCEGAWNAAQKSYSNRFVVFADKAI